MKWCSRLGAEVLGLAAGFALAGCDYSSRNLPAMPEGTFSSPRLPVAEPRGGGTKVAASVKAAGISGEERTAERLAILDNVMKLIANAASNPEGNNFGNATMNLNQFFAGTAKSAYGLSPEAREMLLAKLPWYCLPVLAAIPLAAHVPIPERWSLRGQILALSLLTLAVAAGSIFLVWRENGGIPL